MAMFFQAKRSWRINIFNNDQIWRIPATAVDQRKMSDDSTGIFSNHRCWFRGYIYPSPGQELLRLQLFVQCGAPKIAKLVYNCNFTMVYGRQITIVRWG